MIETRRLKNVVIFIQTILNFVLSRKIIFNDYFAFPTQFLLSKLSAIFSIKRSLSQPTSNNTNVNNKTPEQ